MILVVALVIGLLASVFAALSIWNGALAATGVSEQLYGERYHTFAQRLWLFMAVLYTIGTYIIVFGAGLA